MSSSNTQEVITVEFSKDIFNEAYYDLIFSEKRIINLCGGAGSGKSVFIAQLIIYRVLLESKHRIMVFRKIARTIRNSVYQLFKDLIYGYGLEDLFEFVDSRFEISVPNTGSVILFSGLDDKEKIKSVAGITSVWLEETTEFNLNDFIQINLRLRGKTKYLKQVYLTYNPIDPKHWLNEMFFKNKKENSVTLVTTFEDNKFIDQEYKEQLLALKDIDPTYYKIYGLGSWTVIKGLVFNNYQIIEEFPEPFDDFCFGLDFGYNSPSALTKVGIKEDQIYIEELLYNTKLTIEQIIDFISDLNINQAPIYCDHEAAYIAQMKKNNINAIAADKSVKAGIDYMKQYNLFINKGSANLIKEIQGYKWKEDKNGLPLDEPVKFNDHAVDSARYAVFSHGSKYWYKPKNYKAPKVVVRKINRLNKYEADKI